MRTRVPQPPINPQQRDREHHDFWPGLILTLIGVVTLGCGALGLTGIETTDGDTASPQQLIRAFSLGGLVYSDLAAPPRVDPSTDPAAAAEAMERWERTAAQAGQRRWIVRVDTGARTPCPT